MKARDAPADLRLETCLLAPIEQASIRRSLFRRTTRRRACCDLPDNEAAAAVAITVNARRRDDEDHGYCSHLRKPTPRRSARSTTGRRGS